METKEILEEVVVTNLQYVLSDNYINKEDKQRDFDNAIKAADRLIRLKEIESADKVNKFNKKIELEKVELEKEKNNSTIQLEKEKIGKNTKSDRINRRIKVVEISVVPIGLFVGKCLFQNYAMKQVCNFEKDYTFTTTPSRNIISSLFKFN
ncbi:MAG: hypothetical protein ACI35S_00520 [Anaeroplasma sp.]